MFSFLAAHYGPVEDIEVAWTLIALIGAGFSIYNVGEALKDLRALSTIDKNNGRGRLGRFAIKTEVSRLVTQLIFLAIGALAMSVTTISSPVGLPWNLRLLGIIFRWGLITASILVSLQSYWGYKIRKDFKDEINREVVRNIGEGESVILKGQVELKVDSAQVAPSSDSV